MKNRKEKKIRNVHIAAQPYVRFRATLQSVQANTTNRICYLNGEWGFFWGAILFSVLHKRYILIVFSISHPVCFPCTPCTFGFFLHLPFLLPPISNAGALSFAFFSHFHRHIWISSWNWKFLQRVRMHLSSIITIMDFWFAALRFCKMKYFFLPGNQRQNNSSKWCQIDDRIVVH